MKRHVIRPVAFLLAIATVSFLSLPVQAQRSRSGKSRIQSDVSSDQAQIVGEAPHLYVPRPWEPTNAVPEFRSLYAPVAALSSTTWTSIGPSPLSTGGINPVSGRIVGIAAHPTDANTIYIAAAGGGVWKTADGGTTWAPQTDSQTTVSMGCIAISKSNPLKLYAGTGEANNSLDSNFGRGILVSGDGGTTWTRATGPGGTFDTFRLTCSAIAVDPTNANIAYAAMANQGHNGLFAAGTTGVYKTSDGGTTWVNVTSLNGKDDTFPWSDVAIDANNPANIYAAVGYIFGTANNALYKSSDSGATWTQLAAANAPVGASFGRMSLTVSAASSANVLYAAAEDNTVTSGLARFVRSDDGGTTFNTLTVPNFMGAQGWYDQDLLVDQTSSLISYAAGAANANSILRTANSGGTWSDLSTGLTVSPHVDHHALAFDANGRLLDGDDGGIWRLDNLVTNAWTNLNGNLSTIQFQGIGLHPTNASAAVGGSQDNGTEVFNGVTWTETDGGDGGLAKYNPTTPTVVYHQIPNGSFGTNFFRVSTDGGTTWSTRTTTISGDVNAQQFYAPFVVDPGNGDRVLYGTNKVWETTNQGVTWTALTAVGTGGWNPSGEFVNAIGLAPSTVNTVYAAVHPNGFNATDVFVTTDHGTSWTQRNLPIAGIVQDIQVSPTDPNTAYAVLASFSTGGNVFKTTNAGATWTNVSGNLATVTACTCAIPVWSLQIDNTNGKLYIGAEDGVYVSSNDGTAWTRLGSGLPNGQVYQIQLNKNLNLLGAAIHGRGMWEIQPQVTTAAAVVVAGRVLTSAGSGIRGATITMTDTNGIVRKTMTNAFGYYSFDNVQSGEAYTFVATSRGFHFTPRVVRLNDSVTDLDLIGLH